VADLFPTPGDVNVITIFPGITNAWHRHQLQDDYFYVIKGSVKLAIVDPEGATRVWLLDEAAAEVVRVPRNHWHGYENVGPERAIMLVYLTQKYNVNDEERRALSEMPWPA